MRRPLAWLLGGLAVLRRFRRRRPLAAEGRDSRAEELRQRLAEARELAEERDDFEAGEMTVDQAEPATPDADARRRDVHEAARGTVEQMRGDRTS
jgi:hypothetical protein